MTIPDWADESLSHDLPVLRSRGESQDLEYKSEFPSNSRDLGKEIAAFASSNTGTILIGVEDSGELIGLPECKTPEGRDLIIRRLEGISKGTVKPSITPTAKFAVEEEHVVLVIIVPKGIQPVYYSSNTPYVRHLTEARPAEPHEVVERVTAYLGENPVSPANNYDVEKSQLYSELAKILADILVVASEADMRQVNPWLDMWRSDFRYSAEELREMSVSILSQAEGLEPELRALSDSLDGVADMRLFIGSGGDLKKGVEDVAKLAQEMMTNHFSDIPLAEESLEQVRNQIRTTALKLKDLHRRSESMSNSGRIEELQSEASELARPLTRAARYNIAPIGDGIKEELEKVAQTLHLTETMPLYMDGGISIEAIIDRIGECANRLGQIVEKMN